MNVLLHCETCHRALNPITDPFGGLVSGVRNPMPHRHKVNAYVEFHVTRSWFLVRSPGSENAVDAREWSRGLRLDSYPKWGHVSQQTNTE